MSAHHLHVDFLRTPKEYRKARNYWRDLAGRLFRQNGQSGQWCPWFGIHQKRKPQQIEEGAVYSAYSAALGKAIIIEQYPPRRKEIIFFASVDTFGARQMSYPIRFLRISCELSKETGGFARMHIKKWLNKKTTVKLMRTYIRTFHV